MTIKNATKEPKYIGLSTDDKTNIAQDGAKIYYTDTKNTQIYNGTTWSDYTEPSTIVGSLVNIPVEIAGSILGKTQVFTHVDGSVAFGVETTVIDTTDPIVIDYLVFASNGNINSRLRIQPYIGGVATSIGDIIYDGSSEYGFYPEQMVSYSNGLFNMLEYDLVNNRYKFGLKPSAPMSFAEGVKITVKNISADTAYNIACMLWGRKYD